MSERNIWFKKLVYLYTDTERDPRGDTPQVLSAASIKFKTPSVLVQLFSANSEMPLEHDCALKLLF